MQNILLKFGKMIILQNKYKFLFFINVYKVLKIPYNMKPKNNKQTIHCSWNDIEWLIYDLCLQITKDNVKRTPLFVGISRGGTIPALLLSNQLTPGGFTTISSFCFPKELEKCKFYRDMILVDDLSKSGKTIDKISKELDALNITYEIAVVVDKGKSKKHIDYVGMTTKTKNKIEFPWEKHYDDNYLRGRTTSDNNLNSSLIQNNQ